jgi:hypothetical protein
MDERLPSSSSRSDNSLLLLVAFAAQYPFSFSVSERGVPLVSNGRFNIADRLVEQGAVWEDNGASSIGGPHRDSAKVVDDQHDIQETEKHCEESHTNFMF